MVLVHVDDDGRELVAAVCKELVMEVVLMCG